MDKNGAKGAGAGNGRWEKNLAALKARPPGLDFIPGLPSSPPDFHKIKFLAGEHPSIRVTGEDGRGITLHSTRRALEEAEDLAQTAPLGKSRHLVSLGLGLGYHLLALLPYLDEDQHLILVEQEPEVLWAALASLDLTSLFSRPRTMLVVSPEAAEAVRHLQAMLSGVDDGLAFWGHPPSLRCQKSYYQEVVSRLRPAGAAAVRPVGLNRENLKILLINPDYFLIPEVMRAFRQQGHQVHLALFDKRRDQSEEVLQRLLANIVDYAPDLVFTVNHLGFDREGILLNTLHRLRVPSVSWYVDSPAIILSLYDGPPSDLAFIFVWDPTYIPEVRALGFERVFPLPLATDPGVFSPERARSSRRPQAVTFVGNSLAGSVEQKLARLPRHQEFKELFEEASRSTDLHPCRCLDALLIPADLREHPMICGLDRQELTDFKAALLWRATLKYRLACVRELAPFKPVIYGDSGWRGLVDQKFQLRPEVNYYDELPQVYGASAINFNATSLQMRTAVNQRIFDAPAAGGFVLTDFREQLAELFQVGEEVACYQEAGEITELAQFYLRHPQVREKMTAKARQRVLAEHTYRHRVAVMLDTMRRSL